MASPSDGELILHEPAPLELGMVANPEGFMLSALCNRLEGGKILVSAIRQHVSDALLVPEDSFSLSVGDHAVDYDEFIQVDDAAFLEVSIAFEMLPPHLFSLNRADHVLRVMRVDVPSTADGAEDTPTLVSVVRSHAAASGSNLGGFRHKVTGEMFHNAVAQTDKSAGKRVAKVSSATISREVQTIGRSKPVQTLREGSTQMPKPGGGLSLDRSNDTVLIPGPYLSAATVLQFRRHACIRIQAVVRGFQARVRARALRLQKAADSTVEALELEVRIAADAAARKREIARRTNPRTADDFNVLRSEAEAWAGANEKAQTANGGTLEARRAAYDSAMRVQAHVAGLEAQAKRATAATATERLLDRMAQPKTIATETAVVQVETPFTSRAAELKALVVALNAQPTSIDARLDVLLNVKWTIREFPCPLTVELAELIDREGDLLHRGRRTVGGLRRRISEMFATFCTVPEFNPEAVHHQPAPIEFLARSGVHAKPIRGLTRPLVAPPAALPDRNALDPLAAAPVARAGVTLPALAAPPRLVGPRARRAPPGLRPPSVEGAGDAARDPNRPAGAGSVGPLGSTGPAQHLVSPGPSRAARADAMIAGGAGAKGGDLPRLRSATNASLEGVAVGV